ncbi:hypothetical protein FOWG_18167 [Fusarium oxysporum f. sp. lycopersici MN25]|nr:hypothetical protein FOWG_18167 [Fusarium oxysporum f. sp. lycopersici MN25]
MGISSVTALEGLLGLTTNIHVGVQITIFQPPSGPLKKKGILLWNFKQQ